jgi:hypothetical protein
MSGNKTRSILKKRRTHHNKTIRFKPDHELELVIQISNKEADDGTNWRQEANQSRKEHKEARKEVYDEKMQKEEEVQKVLSAMKDAYKEEVEVVKGMSVTKKHKSAIKELFKPRTKEQEREIAATMINVSKSQGIPLKSVIVSVEAARQSPRRSTLSRMFKGVTRLFSCGTSRRGGRRRRNRKTKKLCK